MFSWILPLLLLPNSKVACLVWPSGVSAESCRLVQPSCNLHSCISLLKSIKWQGHKIYSLSIEIPLLVQVCGETLFCPPLLFLHFCRFQQQRWMQLHLMWKISTRIRTVNVAAFYSILYYRPSVTAAQLATLQ